MASFDPGQELLGKYRIESVLGRGGMGLVLSAVHLDLDTKVAIKVLHGALELKPDVVQRFLQEAKAASRLRSEFVPRVTDFGRLPDGQPFMVMELLEGEDFQSIVQRGRVPVTQAVDAVLQVAAALAEAHSAGIVHRDIKPSNLFRTLRADRSPCVKVLDFGISKVIDPITQLSLTQSSGPLGTPFYMSPEQIRTPREVDERTDVWSLGVVLYEMLAGRLPFRTDQIGELFAHILEKPPPPLQEVRPDLPPGLAHVVGRCLEKDRAQRVGGMRELAELLMPFASSEGAVAARRAGVTLPGNEGESGCDPAARTAPGAGRDSLPSDVGLAETLQADAAGARADSAQKADEPRLSSADPGGPRAAEQVEPSPGQRPGRRARLSIVAVAACVLGLAAVVAAQLMTANGDKEETGAASVPAAIEPPLPPASSAPFVTPAPRESAPSITPAPRESAPASGEASAGAAPAPSPAAPTSSGAAAAKSAAPARPSARPGAPSLAPTAKAAARPSAPTLW